jgi:hypothetical protein
MNKTRDLYDKGLHKNKFIFYGAGVLAAGKA